MYRKKHTGSRSTLSFLQQKANRKNNDNTATQVQILNKLNKTRVEIKTGIIQAI